MTSQFSNGYHRLIVALSLFVGRAFSLAHGHLKVGSLGASDAEDDGAEDVDG